MKGKRQAAPAEGDPPVQGTATTSGTRLSLPTKRKREEASDPEEDDDVINISSDTGAADEYDYDDLFEADTPPRSRRGREPLGSLTRKAETRPNVIKVDPDSEEEIDIPDFDEDDWTYSHRPPPQQRRRTKSPLTVADLSDF